MDIPKDKNYPADAVQCDNCGGHGCTVCNGKGWLPGGMVVPEKPTEATLHAQLHGRRCENPECGKPIPPDCVAVYCSNECAMDDA